MTEETLVIGAKMPDGTVYAGISPDTKRPMYTTPRDEPLKMSWRKAMKTAKKKDFGGHKDWRVPTQGELKVLFKNAAAIGAFDTSGTIGHWYWSSWNYNAGYSVAVEFSSGGGYGNPKQKADIVRFVRD